MDVPRYAIYFVPPSDSALYRFGASFLGYDCYTGVDLGYPEKAGLDATEWAALTRDPRIYGFHATMKAPFALSSTFTEADAALELQRFAALPRIIPTIEPAVQSLGNFIAIVPAGDDDVVRRLAADCVTAFDRFRRPMTPQERGQRMKSGLNSRQVENLDRWGYPYVFEEFRFHMTLTGRIDPGRRHAIVTLLQDLFIRANGARPLSIARLVLLRQHARSMPFRVIRQVDLTAPL
jgi:putative phosphonate metabolism protein